MNRLGTGSELRYVNRKQRFDKPVLAQDRAAETSPDSGFCIQESDSLSLDIP